MGHKESNAPAKTFHTDCRIQWWTINRICLFTPSRAVKAGKSEGGKLILQILQPFLSAHWRVPIRDTNPSHPHWLKFSLCPVTEHCSWLSKATGSLFQSNLVQFCPQTGSRLCIMRTSTGKQSALGATRSLKTQQRETVKKANNRRHRNMSTKVSL